METRTFPAAGAVVLDLSVAAGDIRVSEQQGAVTVGIRGEQDPDAVEMDAIEEEDGTLHISVRERKHRMTGWRRRHGLDVTIATPPDTRLTVEGGSTDLKAKGRLAEVKFSSGSGDVRLERVDGDVDVKGASGDVRVGHVGGHLKVHSASGDLAVTSVENGATVRSASGDISISALSGVSAITTLSGDVVVDTLHPTSLAIQAVSGDVEVGLVPGLAAMLDVSTVSGSTRSDLDVSGTPPPDQAPTVELRVNTVSGDVRVRRATKGLHL